MNGTGISASDIMALIGNRNDGFLEGNGIIIIILFFLIFGFGGNWGGNATASALGQAEIQTALFNQTTDRNLSDIRTGQFGIQQDIANSNYNSLAQFKDLSQQMCQTCAELNANVIKENQATRDLINQHYVNELADKLSIARNELSNMQQNQYLISTFGRVVPNPPVPYCGCGSNLY